MHQQIQERLRQLAQERDITLLLAVETGSRAWGFPSPDSDYDVRLIYAHRPEWYLTVGTPKDSIEAMYEERMIDISGWELRKALRLLSKSNAALLERLQSPIVYAANPDFLADVRPLADRAYSRVATLNHYLSMGQKLLADMRAGGPDYRLKKFFYTLRCATLCQWILDREDVPPIVFTEAYRGVNLPVNLQQRIEALIALKAERDEAYRHRGEAELFTFVEAAFQRAEAARASLPAGRFTTAAFDAVLRKYIHST